MMTDKELIEMDERFELAEKIKKQVIQRTNKMLQELNVVDKTDYEFKINLPGQTLIISG